MLRLTHLYINWGDLYVLIYWQKIFNCAMSTEWLGMLSGKRGFFRCASIKWKPSRSLHNFLQCSSLKVSLLPRLWRSMFIQFKKKHLITFIMHPVLAHGLTKFISHIYIVPLVLREEVVLMQQDLTYKRFSRFSRFTRKRQKYIH